MFIINVLLFIMSMLCSFCSLPHCAVIVIAVVWRSLFLFKINFFLVIVLGVNMPLDVKVQV